MNGPLLTMLRTGYSSRVTRIRQFARRPLLVNLRGVLQRIPFRPLDINCFYLMEYSGIPPVHANFIRGRAELRRGTLDDLEGLTACQDTPRAFLNRFASGDHCSVAVLDGRIVGYQWYCDKPLYVEERYAYKIDVPPDAIYTYDVFILPEHRLSGLWFKFHSVYLRGFMQTRRRQRIIGIIDYDNRLSMNTHLRFGFRPTGRVFVIKMLGRSFFMRKALPGGSRDLARWTSAAVGSGACGPKGGERSPTPGITGSVRTQPTVGPVHTTNAPKQS